MVALFLYLKGMTGALAPLSYLAVNTRLDRKNLERTNTLASETKRIVVAYHIHQTLSYKDRK